MVFNAVKNPPRHHWSSLWFWYKTFIVGVCIKLQHTLHQNGGNFHAHIHRFSCLQNFLWAICTDNQDSTDEMNSQINSIPFQCYRWSGVAAVLALLLYTSFSPSGIALHALMTSSLASKKSTPCSWRYEERSPGWRKCIIKILYQHSTSHVIFFVCWVLYNALAT